MPASIYNSYLRLLKCVSYKTGLSMDVCACVWGSVVGSHPFMSTPYEHFTVKLANGLSRSVPLPVCECYSRHVTLCTLLVSLFYRSAVSIYYTSHHEAFGFYLTLGWWMLLIIDTVDTSPWNNVLFRKFSNVVMFQFILLKKLTVIAVLVR